MSCSYPSIKETDCVGEAIITINDHFKWIDTKTAEIVSFSERIAESISSLQSIIPAASYLSTSINGISGISRADAFRNTLTTFPSTTCCYGKPVTLFYPYEVLSKADYDAKVLNWIEKNFDPSDTSCSFNEVYVIAFKGYVDEQPSNRDKMLVKNYKTVYDVENNSERFIIGRFYRAGYPLLKWNLSPALSPFGCAEAVKRTIVETCAEIEQTPTVFYYKFTSCTIPGLAFFSAQDYSYLLGQGAILDGYPSDIFLLSKVPAGSQPLKTDLNVLLATKAGCGETCFLLTNEYGEQITSVSKILDAYAGRTSVELEGFVGTWRVEKTTEGCDCACVVTVSKANVDVYKLTNCCAAFLPCPDVQVKDLPKDIWVFDNTGQNYLQSGKAVELQAYPGVRWSIAVEQFDNQKITTDYRITDIFESCKSLAKPNPNPKTYYKLIGSCLNAFRTDLYSDSAALKPYVGKVVNINFDNNNYYMVGEFTSIATISNTLVSIVDVNLYGNNFPEFETTDRVVDGLIIDKSNFSAYDVAGASYYPKPTPAYTNAPVDTCVRKFSYWYETTNTAWVRNKVENYSKILNSWYESESWFAFSDGQLFDIAAKSLGYTPLQLSSYIASKNLYIEISVTFKRYRKVLRPSRDQLYGEETDSIAEITNVKLYNATISTVASFQGLVSCGAVYLLTNYCNGQQACVVEGGTSVLATLLGRIVLLKGGGVFTITQTDKKDCKIVSLINPATILAVLTDAEAQAACTLLPPENAQGVPVSVRDINCNVLTIYFDDTNNRYHYDADISPGTLVDGIYAGDGFGGLYGNYLYNFNNGIPSELGVNCCNKEKSVYGSCCKDGAYSIWEHPTAGDKVFESVQSCHEYIATNECTSADGIYFDSDNPCAQIRVTGCVTSVADPFHCRNQETYYDCDDQSTTLYIDRKESKYYTNEESACLCEGATFSDEGPLGLGGAATEEGDGYSFSDGVRSSSPDYCISCSEDFYYVSCDDDAQRRTFYYKADPAGQIYYYDQASCESSEGFDGRVGGEYYGPGGSGAGERNAYTFSFGRKDNAGQCTTTTTTTTTTTISPCSPETYYADCSENAASETLYYNGVDELYYGNESACKAQSAGFLVDGEKTGPGGVEEPRPKYQFSGGLKSYDGLCAEPTTTPAPPTTTPEPTTTPVPIYGCMDPEAFNYNPMANYNTGCIPRIYGCMDPSASNYNSEANTDDYSCAYETTTQEPPPPPTTTEEPTTTQSPVYGCTDPTALNYNPAANINDGCIPRIYGCMDPSASNYSEAANTDDSSCIYPTTPEP